MTGNSHLLWTYNWVKVGTVTLKWAAAVSCGIPRICRGEPQNLAIEFGKICRWKLWSLVIIHWMCCSITRFRLANDSRKNGWSIDRSLSWYDALLLVICDWCNLVNTEWHSWVWHKYTKNKHYLRSYKVLSSIQCMSSLTSLNVLS